MKDRVSRVLYASKEEFKEKNCQNCINKRCTRLETFSVAGCKRLENADIVEAFFPAGPKKD